MKTTFIRTKNFVSRNKSAIAVSVIATLAIAQQHKHISQLNKFLEEKDLIDEYYNTDE